MSQGQNSDSNNQGTPPELPNGESPTGGSQSGDAKTTENTTTTQENNS